MTALPGGSADKLGNRYEAWWTLWRVAGVIEGSATRIRLEPPGDGGDGAEFWIEEAGARWYEQAKNAQRQWTLQRLISQGVLLSVRAHLAAGHQFRLVTSTGAPELDSLSSRARAAATPEEYDSILTQIDLPRFRSLAKAWRVTEATAWAYLGRIHVEHHPVDSLRRLVHQRYEILVHGDPEVVVNELRGWLDNHLHQEISAPSIWGHLKSKGFARRTLVGDPDTLQALTATVERQQRRTKQARPAIMAATQARTTQLVERLVAADGRQVVILHGRAGAGKSTTAADALRDLSRDGWLAAAVRMDGATATTQTASALGHAFDLAASPVAILAAASEGSPAVLLVDQLDAVSTYSGRMPDSYEAVAELLDQVASLPNIKVVLVVRTVDLQADSRMRSLLVDETRVETLELGDLTADEVKDALDRSGVNMEKLTPATLELLRVPLHLAIFSGLTGADQVAPFRTLSDLYERFTNEVRRKISREIGHLDWRRTIDGLVRYMSEREILGAPSGVLDDADPIEVASLVSQGVLTWDGGRYAIFHETYFDFLFARSFIANGGDLHDFLVGSGQSLFRRAQARQVLEYLAAIDRNRFRRLIVRLLTSDSLRPHLQDVVITMLAQLDAAVADWRVIEPLAFGKLWLGPRLAALLSVPTWFDAADADGRWEVLLANQSTANLAADQLTNAGSQRPERVAALVRPYIGTTEAWRLRLRSIVEWSLTPGLVDLAVELVEDGHLEAPQGSTAVTSDFWSIVYRLDIEDPIGATRLVGAYLRRSSARARAEGAIDPFGSGHLDTRSSAGGDSLIGRLARAAPSTFLDEVLPFIVRVVSATAVPTYEGSLRSSHRWGIRYISSHHGIDGALFTGVEVALRALPDDQPQQVAELVRPLASSDVKELRFLACRALTRVGTGNIGIDWLLSDDRNLELGWADSRRWASRELVETATRECDDVRLHALVERLLSYYPLLETSKMGRYWRGRAQFELMTAIEPLRRNQVIERRLGELERKLGAIPLRGPEPVAASFVGPPIPQEAAIRMADRDWLRAIERYRDDTTNWRAEEAPLGGARELAGLLGSRAEAEPERFARLALRFGSDTPIGHYEHVIRAIVGKVPISLFVDVCAHARCVVGQPVGLDICHATGTVASEANDALVDLIVECSSDIDPYSESARTPAASGQHYYNGDLETAGLNSTRGAAAGTIARILFAQPERADVLKQTIAKLAADEILAVRTQAAQAVMALMRPDLDAALDLAAELFDAPVEIFDSESSSRLLRYALLNDQERFAPSLCRALNGPESIAERAGGVWAIVAVRDLIAEPVPRDLTGLSAAARRGAATALAGDPSVTYSLLTRLFDDSDFTVRETAASAMRLVGELTAEVADPLIRTFAASDAFAHNFEEMFFALDHSQRLFPESTIMACERVVEIASQGMGDARTVRAAAGIHVIEVILRLYRQSGGQIRERCLDLIDDLAIVGSYGIERALGGER